MAASTDQRAYPNPSLHKWTVGSTSDSDSDSVWDDSVCEALAQIRDEYLTLVTTEVPPKSKEIGMSVYTGTGGIVATLIKLLDCSNEPTSQSESEGEWCVDRERVRELLRGYTKTLAKKRKDRPGRITFFTGVPGTDALIIAASALLGDEDTSEYADALREYPSHAFTAADSYELLYGRCGYLSAAIYANAYVPGTVPDSVLSSIAIDTVQVGVNNAHEWGVSGEWPLMWEWHNSMYIGGAHGVIGILDVLLQVKHVLEGQTVRMPDGSNGDCMELVRDTVDALVAHMHPSGNITSSVGKDKDKLVQWCHGATGLVLVLCTAARVFEDRSEDYVAAAVRAGECLWERGILLKGPGLCHGVCGNAYPFLELYRTTGDAVYRRRAAEFAIVATSEEYRDVMGEPDSPYSLFQGWSALVCLANDTLETEYSYFVGQQAPRGVVVQG